MDVIMTERLELRPLALTDLDHLAALYAQPIVMQFITGVALTHAQTYAGLMGHINNHARYGFGLCAIRLRQTGQFIGRGGLSPIDTAQGVIGEVGWLLDRAYWGMGLATELGHASIAIGFGDLKLARIFARAYVANTASICVMHKLGMHLAWETAEEVEYKAFSPYGK